MKPVRLSFLILAGALMAAPAGAAQTGGCGAFAWPIAPDLKLLAQPRWVESGASVDVAAPIGLRLGLKDDASADFALPPQRTPAPRSQGGILRFEAKAGVYQITLTEAAWTDLVQDGRALQPTEFSGVLDCEGARKTLRYELSAGPATLQISNAPGRSIGVALTPPK
ncbi:hypothetical protein [Hansschlegelia sp.]|uniref:hypothetical protein n=1 Tax=Hansschlegelia sp. TaxID=2041892 RepID=UPI002C367D3A|nr:hypothetical protein [Hansschlegelia sp.]HVI29700.1 hypothetical protein [Hansschlegelia sp.]